MAGRRALGALVLAACAAGAGAAPAGGIGYWSPGSNGGVSLGDDASACFQFTGIGAHVVVASAVGLVSTSGTVADVHTSRARRLSEYMADVVTSVRADDPVNVCVGGVGERVVAGWAVFTFTAHGQETDIGVVISCSYHPGGKNCR